MATPATDEPRSRAGRAAAVMLTGGSSPTGTVTFRVFGPGDDTCARAPIVTSVKPVTAGTGPRVVSSGPVVVPGPGTYHFVTSYGGDAANAPVGPTPCPNLDEAIGFGASSFSFSARASAAGGLGVAISDTAAVASSSVPTGSVAFALFGPGAVSCTGTPIFTSVRPVTPSGSSTSGPFTPIAPGTYRWVASYSGDADDPSAASRCDDPAQAAVIMATTTTTGPTSTTTTSTSTTTVPGPCAGLRRQQDRLRQQLASVQQVLARLGGHRTEALVEQLRSQLARALAACAAAVGPARSGAA